MLRLPFLLTVSSFLLAVFFVSVFKVAASPFILELMGKDPILIHYLNGQTGIEELKHFTQERLRFSADEVQYFTVIKNLFNEYINPLFVIGFALILFMFFLTPEILKDLSYYAFSISICTTFIVTASIFSEDFYILLTTLQQYIPNELMIQLKPNSLTYTLYAPNFLLTLVICCFFFASCILFGLHLGLKRKLMES